MVVGPYQYSFINILNQYYSHFVYCSVPPRTVFNMTCTGLESLWYSDEADVQSTVKLLKDDWTHSFYPNGSEFESISTGPWSLQM